MLVTFKLYENGTYRQYSYDVPTLSNAFLPISYIDPRRIRPFTFHDFSNYTFEEAPDFNVDLQRLVQLANSSIKPKRIDRLKDSLCTVVSEHIKRCNRVLFNDLLMYVDCLGFICVATGEMESYDVSSEYPKWAKMLVDKYGSYVKCSTKFGPVPFKGSMNDRDLQSLL